MVWHFRGIQRVECVLIDSFTIILFVLLLWLLATKSTKYIGKLKNKAKPKKPNKTGNFSRGECLGSPYTDDGPEDSKHLTIAKYLKVCR